MSNAQATAQVPTADILAAAPAGTWHLDPVHSSVQFEIDYLGGTFKGEFRDVEAQLDVHDRTATLSGAAQVASVDVKDENLAAHLHGPDFFDAERFPELRFSADQFGLDGDAVTVQGEVTIKGVTEPVAVAGTVVPPITDPAGRERIGLKVATSVDRSAFGVSWNAELPGGGQALSNDVVIVADLFFVKA
jgi:polyisoprenoid-binding protein YceI